jgi:predicted nucleotidyltransferase component of viral defense system
MTLIEEIAKHGRADPFWTFGGGTALMLRYGHRLSKDIDIFVPDPQSLGYITPRLSDVAESITRDYQEGAGYVKLHLPEGEIDFIAAPNLTSPGFEWRSILGYQVRLETAAEIIAKKMWHRGDRIVGRDIFDFAMVAAQDHEALMENKSFILRHGDAIFKQLNERRIGLEKQFNAIDTLNFRWSFDEACSSLYDQLIAMRSS